jgi:hypothetical protein
MEPGEIGIEITPILADPSLEPEFAARLDALLRRTCHIARALTGAELAAVKLWIGEESSEARKYFSMSEKYEAFRDFRVDPRGAGLHGMRIPPGEVIRLTHAEVLARGLEVMDAAAVALARDNRIPVIVFSIRQPGAFVDILKGAGRATIVADS